MLCAVLKTANFYGILFSIKERCDLQESTPSCKNTSLQQPGFLCPAVPTTAGREKPPKIALKICQPCRLPMAGECGKIHNVKRE